VRRLWRAQSAATVYYWIKCRNLIPTPHSLPRWRSRDRLSISPRQHHRTFVMTFIPQSDKRLGFLSLLEKRKEIVVIARKKSNPRHPKPEISLKEFFCGKHCHDLLATTARKLLEKLWKWGKAGKRQILTEVKQVYSVPTVVMQTDVSPYAIGACRIKALQRRNSILPIAHCLAVFTPTLLHGAIIQTRATNGWSNLFWRVGNAS